MKVYIKIHRYGDKKFVAMCDENLLGKTLESDELRITISDFYKGELYEVDNVSSSIFEDVLSINAVGENSLNLLRKFGLVDQNSQIMEINGVPIALIFFI